MCMHTLHVTCIYTLTHTLLTHYLVLTGFVRPPHSPHGECYYINIHHHKDPTSTTWRPNVKYVKYSVSGHTYHYSFLLLARSCLNNL